MVEPVILVHGGAWGVPDCWVQDTLRGVRLAASTGYRILQDGGSALDAVEAAVRSMEDDEVFNAGIGASLNLCGEVGHEASIQRGSDLSAGCVTLINDVPHPVTLARKVLEESPHAFIGGEGARQFAIKQGIKLLSPNFSITEAAKEELKDFLKSSNGVPAGKDTVGAVVVDRFGHVAAATSTGGTAGKYVGRIGDAPQIGSGTYADDSVGAVSSTGHGETILKFCLAHTIINSMANGKTSECATTDAVNTMTKRLHNTGGAICVSNKGDVGFHFTTNRMSWCYVKAGEMHYGIEPKQHETEKYTG